jgi:L-idonate 5-dehydrogenase
MTDKHVVDRSTGNADAPIALHDGPGLSSVITHRFPLEQADEALAVAGDRSSGSSKVMLRLGGDR